MNSFVKKKKEEEEGEKRGHNDVCSNYNKKSDH